MTVKQKAVNYSAEAVAAIVADYKAGKSLESIAQECGRTIASVRAKLASLGVYAKKEKPIEGKKGGVTKASLVSDIAAIVTGSKDSLESFQAATMSDLKSLLAFLVAEMRDDVGLDKLE